MAKIEKDPLTGVTTTGHEWDGIRELNNPMPNWWVKTYLVTIAWALGFMVFMPSWPSLSSYMSGVLGYNTRAEVAEDLKAHAALQKGLADRIVAADLETLVDDTELVRFAQTSGKTAFNTNCAGCHGVGGGGQGLFPSLGDDDWIWGGRLPDIVLTIRHGIRSADPDARTSEMPWFLRDGLLEDSQVTEVAAFVPTLSEQEGGDQSLAGATLYAENCASCHGETGEGLRDVGAPSLKDQIWLYGQGAEAVAAQIARPRHGVMPAWGGRLDEATIRMLALYVHSLGGGER